MAGLITKQPNELYARISTVVDGPTHWNMSKAELTQYLVETEQLDYVGQSAAEWMERYGKSFGDAMTYIKTSNMTENEIADWVREVS